MPPWVQLQLLCLVTNALNPALMERHTPSKRVPVHSRLAGTVRDRPDARQLTGRITLIEKFQENARQAANRLGPNSG